MELIGVKEQVDAAGQWLGCSEGSGLETSVVMVAAAIAIGIVVGLLEVRLGGVPLALSISGGVLVLGLVVGSVALVYPGWPGGTAGAVCLLLLAAGFALSALLNKLAPPPPPI